MDSPGKEEILAPFTVKMPEMARNLKKENLFFGPLRNEPCAIAFKE